MCFKAKVVYIDLLVVRASNIFVKRDYAECFKSAVPSENNGSCVGFVS